MRVQCLDQCLKDQSRSGSMATEADLAASPLLKTVIAFFAVFPMVWLAALQTLQCLHTSLSQRLTKLLTAPSLVQYSNCYSYVLLSVCGLCQLLRSA